MTLGWSDWLTGGTAKKSQLEWCGALTKISPSLEVELEIEQIIDHRDSWIRMMSK